MSAVDESLYDGVTAQQLFHNKDSNDLTFDDVISLVRSATACITIHHL